MALALVFELCLIIYCLIFIKLTPLLMRNSQVVDHTSVDRLWQVTFQALVCILADFGALFVNILIDSFALAVRQDIHRVRELALLHNYLTVLDLTNFYV